MRIFKIVKCVLVGHKLDTPSEIQFLDKRNYLKKCSRCGMYIAHSHLSGISIMMGKRGAENLKREFAKEFPYAKKECAKNA